MYCISWFDGTLHHTLIGELRSVKALAHVFEDEGQDFSVKLVGGGQKISQQAFGCGGFSHWKDEDD